MSKNKGESRQLFEWVKYSEEKPQSGNGRKQYLVRDIMYTQWLMYGITSKRWEDVFEWLKPIQSSLKEEVLLKDSDEFLIKIAGKMGLYVDFSDKGYDGDKEAPMDRFGFLDYLLTHAASLTPKSIRDSDAVEFLNWVNKQGYKEYQPGKFRKKNELIRFTTEQLYKHFQIYTVKSASLKPNK